MFFLGGYSINSCYDQSVDAAANMLIPLAADCWRPALHNCSDADSEQPAWWMWTGATCFRSGCGATLAHSSADLLPAFASCAAAPNNGCENNW